MVTKSHRQVNNVLNDTHFTQTVKITYMDIYQPTNLCTDKLAPVTPKFRGAEVKMFLQCTEDMLYTTATM